MRTLQEKYNAILEGNFSKAQFIKDARYELPSIISQYNGFEDTVSILKSKSMIHEAKKKDQPAVQYSDESYRRGCDAELEKAGIDSAGTISDEDYAKAREKVVKNLGKDPNHYLNLLSGDSNKVDKHDQLISIKRGEGAKDIFNGLKKADLREMVTKLMKEASPYAKLSKDSGKAISKSLGIGQNKAKKKEKDIKTEDHRLVDKFRDKADKDKGIKNAKIKKSQDANAYARYAEKSEEDAFNVYEGGSDFASDIMKTWKDQDVISNDLIAFMEELAKRNGPEAIDDFKELLQALISQENTLQEGRARKIKGGKIVTEDDYATGGYVESMGPKLEKALKYLTKVWDEWKNGPMTEPGMVTHAKKDLIKYLSGQLQEIEESKDDDMDQGYLINKAEQDKRHAKIEKKYKEDDEREAEIEEGKVKEKLKEGFKKIIKGILTEDKKLLKEAKSENLERFINYENDANEDLAQRIRKGATELADHIAKIEKAYLDTRQSIENIYTNIGSFMSPAVSIAFKKDLDPVLHKYMSIDLPKTQRMDPEEMQKLGFDPSDTSAGVNEGRKTKYTKRKK